MPSPLASLDDLEDRLGRTLDGGELARAHAALADASVLVRAAAGRSWLDSTTGELTEVSDLAVSVTLSAAKRAVDNPDGYVSERIGDYSYTRASAPAGGEVGGVYLTEEERMALRGLRGAGGLATLSYIRAAPFTRGVPIANGEPL